MAFTGADAGSQGVSRAPTGEAARGATGETPPAEGPLSSLPTSYSSRAVSLPPSDPAAGSRFLPGTVLDARYRIVGPLGSGGMGEVYRADDLKLGQPVALKFLPEALQQDPDRLQRFLAEVRLTRQISHPSVCRVYDVGEVGGVHFLSMEYIDGEDLASLLRRIGRLPGDKAVQIARQVCAGLAAAHELGVLHRDLKPANIMIDGRGQARVTDFGIASLAGDIPAEEIRSGTPQYMAPEQLAGTGVSIQSDIYSLGLTLYELFTGKAAFTAGSPRELLRLQSETTPASPSTVVDGVDPAAERIILRCLEREPGDRPASALAVSAALPGGDPLAAALAAGETPSPEMVAAAGTEQALKPAVAWAMLIGFLLLLGVNWMLFGSDSLVHRLQPPKSRDVLRAASRQIIADIGHEVPVFDTASDFAYSGNYLRWVADNDDSNDRWDRLRGLRHRAIFFWYRQSPQPMVGPPGFSRTALGQPPMTTPGEALLLTDLEGRLLRLIVQPPQVVEQSPEDPPAPDWTPVLAAAGLDPALLTPTTPIWVPDRHVDTLAAWEGTAPGHPDVPLRVEAGALRGKVIHFLSQGPWTDVESAADYPAPRPLGARLFGDLDTLMNALLLVVGLFLARRNLRLGRGDRAGATKLALTFLAIHLLVWAGWADHFVDLRLEWHRVFRLDTGYSMFLAAEIWVLYLALEPFVRRRWPETLISWSRLLRGRFADPIVGRDILIGTVFVMLALPVTLIPDFYTVWSGQPPPMPNRPALMTGPFVSLLKLIDLPIHSVMDGLRALFLLVVIQTLVRKQWLTIALFVLVFTPVAFSGSWGFMAAGALVLTVGAFLILRFGLLVIITTSALADLATQDLLTTDLTQWYAFSTTASLLAMAALGIWAFRASLGGTPAFRTGLLDD